MKNRRATIHLKKLPKSPVVRLAIQRGRHRSEWGSDLRWAEREQSALTKKVLRLRDDQIISLFPILGITFDRNDISAVVREVRKNRGESIHIDTLFSEANSKEILRWWINFFSRHR